MTWTAVALSLALLDVNGVKREPLRVETGKANALFFVTNDCPISNSYAHEIARICADYKSKGVNCTLVYVDPGISDKAARQHAQEFGHGGYAKVLDRRHELVRATGVTITPEVAVVNRAGKVVYRGRIDDSYAALGQPRRPAMSFDLRHALDEFISGNRIETPETKALGCYISDFRH